MRIEIRWAAQDPMAEVVLVQLGDKPVGLKLEWAVDPRGKYQAIWYDAPNWLEYQTRFEFILIPTLKRLGVKDPAIYIDGCSLGAWLANLEQKYILLRDEAWLAVNELKKTRKFFRNKHVETVRKKLELILQHFCAPPPAAR